MNKLALSIDQAAEVAEVGRNTLRALVKDGKLPAIYVGAKVLILVKDLEIFLSLNRGVDLLNAGRVRPLKNEAYNYEKLCG